MRQSSFYDSSSILWSLEAAEHVMQPLKIMEAGKLKKGPQHVEVNKETGHVEVVAKERTCKLIKESSSRACKVNCSDWPLQQIYRSPLVRLTR